MGGDMAEGMSYTTLGGQHFRRWRTMFTSKQVSDAARATWQNKVYDFQFDECRFSCRVHMGAYRYEVHMDELPAPGEAWEDMPIYCTCRRAMESRAGSSYY